MESFLQEIMPALLELANFVVLAAIGWASTALKTWMDERGATQQLIKYSYLADIAVSAVEQVYKNEHGDQKLAKAKSMFLESLPPKAKITPMQLDGFLEAAVKRMNDEWTTTEQTAISIGGEDEIYKRFHERVGQ